MLNIKVCKKQIIYIQQSNKKQLINHPLKINTNKLTIYLSNYIIQLIIYIIFYLISSFLFHTQTEVHHQTQQVILIYISYEILLLYSNINFLSFLNLSIKNRLQNFSFTYRFAPALHFFHFLIVNSSFFATIIYSPHSKSNITTMQNYAILYNKFFLFYLQFISCNSTSRLAKACQYEVISFLLCFNQFSTFFNQTVPDNLFIENISSLFICNLVTHRYNHS
ncbi:transmembrane protein, putative (macronuclear) [Tetrahymena thermophila SB210]|uniref:Transmembrane protein, putative n=1 Tax=Tetrahymena thermophila (strain SB210) TaxID=312017 RepID=W7XK20_TETTS|nr:transmembrane protein, putative [Tetrahymena thermophila SB210]EWS74524.1 transmembrane protein, putative [Tetrahymena thermophila SB210]|eukprot:XP_012652954.1 transmembrane protein, putative [Tetrahymena thermophila SB210]